MVSLTALWLPIVLAAVAVFIASSIIHMVFKYHNSEYRQLPDEGAILDAMRNAKVGRGFYSFPYAGSMKEMGVIFFLGLTPQATLLCPSRALLKYLPL